MADGGVSLNVALDNRVSAGLKKLALSFRPSELAKVLDEIGASNVTETQMRFEAEAGPDGKKWQRFAFQLPRTPPVPKWRHQSNPKLLRDTGNLYDSVTHKVHMLGVTVGTNRVYARIHQLGGTAGRGRKVTIPARPYLGVSAEGQREMLQILTDHVEGK